MSAKVNKQYNIADPRGFVAQISAFQRRRMYARFLRDTGVMPEHSILDVGVTSDREFSASNYLEEWYPYKNRITAVGMDDASYLTALYPGMRFVRANGCSLPFSDKSFNF